MRSRSSLLMPWPGPLERSPGTLSRGSGRKAKGRKETRKNTCRRYLSPPCIHHMRVQVQFSGRLSCAKAREPIVRRATCTYFIFSSGFYLRSPELFLYIYIYYSLYPRARACVRVYYASLWRTEIVLVLQKITASDNSTNIIIIIKIVVCKKGIFPRVHRVYYPAMLLHARSRERETERVITYIHSGEERGIFVFRLFCRLFLFYFLI